MRADAQPQASSRSDWPPLLTPQLLTRLQEPEPQLSSRASESPRFPEPEPPSPVTPPNVENSRSHDANRSLQGHMFDVQIRQQPNPQVQHPQQLLSAPYEESLALAQEVNALRAHCSAMRASLEQAEDELRQAKLQMPALASDAHISDLLRCMSVVIAPHYASLIPQDVPFTKMSPQQRIAFQLLRSPFDVEIRWPEPDGGKSNVSYAMQPHALSADKHVRNDVTSKEYYGRNVEKVWERLENLATEAWGCCPSWREDISDDQISWHRRGSDQSSFNWHAQEKHGMLPVAGAEPGRISARKQKVEPHPNEPEQRSLHEEEDLATTRPGLRRELRKTKSELDEDMAGRRKKRLQTGWRRHQSFPAEMEAKRTSWKDPDACIDSGKDEPRRKELDKQLKLPSQELEETNSPGVLTPRFSRPEVIDYDADEPNNMISDFAAPSKLRSRNDRFSSNDPSDYTRSSVGSTESDEGLMSNAALKTPDSDLTTSSRRATCPPRSILSNRSLICQSDPVTYEDTPQSKERKKRPTLRAESAARLTATMDIGDILRSIKKSVEMDHASDDWKASDDLKASTSTVESSAAQRKSHRRKTVGTSP